MNELIDRSTRLFIARTDGPTKFKMARQYDKADAMPYKTGRLRTKKKLDVYIDDLTGHGTIRYWHVEWSVCWGPSFWH
jgi:hypothetical protein